MTANVWTNTWFVLLAEPPASSIATVTLPVGLTDAEVWAQLQARYPDALGFRGVGRPTPEWTKP